MVLSYGNLLTFSKKKKKTDVGVDQKRDESKSGTTMKKRSSDAMAKIRSDGASVLTRKTSRKILPEDEDYIVFCFREDGAFDVLKDNPDKSSASALASAQLDSASSTAPTSVNRKVSTSALQSLFQKFKLR